MILKNWYFKLMAEDLKRRIWLIALISLVLFFSFPVMAMLFTTINGYDYDSYYNSYQRSMEILVSLDNTWMPFFLSISVIVAACSSFSFLNSKSKVDFYHSLPVRREKLFLVNFIDGYLIMAVLYACFLLLAIIGGSVNGASGHVLIAMGIKSYFVNMSFFLLLYATVTVALMMTGNRIVGLLGVGVFYFYIPITAALMEGYCSTWLLTYYYESSVWAKGMQISPYIQYLVAFESDTPVKRALIALLAGLVITLFALWLYKKRPSEGAGKSLVFAFSKPVIRIAITITSGMAGAMFGWSIRGRMGWTLFFLICGSLIAHCVIEIIYHADFRKLFSNRLQLAGCVVAGVVLVFVFRYDVTGYDRYIPKADAIESISINIDELDYWVEYGEAANYENRYLSWKWADRTEYLFEHIRITDTEPVLALAARGIDAAADKREELADYGRYYNYYSSLYVKYRLKSGRTVTRCYYLPLQDMEGVIESLYAVDDFKYGMYPLLTETEEIAYVRYDQNSKSTDLGRGDSAQARQLLEAYRQDFMEQTITDRRQESPIAELRFVLNSEYEMFQLTRSLESAKGTDDYLWQENNVLSYNYYPLYPSFERTISCLKEAGIEPDEPLKGRTLTGIGMKVLPDYIFELTGDKAWDNLSESKYLYLDVSEEEFGQISGLVYPARYSHYNPFITLDERVGIMLSFIDGDDAYYDRDYSSDNTNNWNYAFPVDQVPESVNQEILKSADSSL